MYTESGMGGVGWGGGGWWGGCQRSMPKGIILLAGIYLEGGVHTSEVDSPPPREHKTNETWVAIDSMDPPLLEGGGTRWEQMPEQI